MANLNDQKIIEEMMRCPDQLMAEYFSVNAHRIIDDAVYWNALGTLWKLGGMVIQQDLWLPMFRSDRRGRHKIMKGRERKKWRRLPKTFVAYRAVNCADEAETAISLSLCKDTVERLFSEDGKREVVEREFNKSEVFAFFDRRGEDEILVNI